MAVVSTVCPLDLSSRDQLQLIACEAQHLQGDYPGDKHMLELLERLKLAALELKQYWVDRREVVAKPVAAEKPKKRKKPQPAD